jgi:hypothetical protein
MSGNYGDGAEPMEWQAKTIAENAMRYNGSAPCPTCGVIMNPVEFLSNRGHCLACTTQMKAKRAQNKMVR